MKRKIIKGVALLGMSVVLTMGMLSCKHGTDGSGSGSEGRFDETTGEGTVKGVKFKMISIAEVKGGASTIGDDSEGNNDKRPVQISAYMIGETEVTQELWKAVMGTNPSYFKDNPETGEVQAKRPVEQVSWYDAIAFCNKLTEKVNGDKDECVYYSDAGFTTVYESGTDVYMNMAKKGFRLPTESEWEWAAKGGTEDKWAGTNTEGDLVDCAWYDSNSDNKTHEVKKKKANEYGLYDMSGNVWEWNWDWLADITGGADLGKDYTGESSGSYRCIRGGSWFRSAGRCARAFRSGGTPDDRYDVVGVRLACRP